MALDAQRQLRLSLESYKTVRDAAHADLKHARVELDRAQTAYDKAEEGYQRVVYSLLLLRDNQ